MTLLSVAVNFKDCNQHWTPQWIIRGIWQKNGVNFLFGPPKSRKSTLRAHWLACALTGEKACEVFPVEERITRPLLCLGEENEHADATRLAHALWNRHPLAAMGTAQTPGLYDVRLVPPSAWRLDSSRFITQFRTELVSEGIDCVVFDPLVHFHRQDENSAGGMNLVAAGLRQLALITTVVVVHHTAKPGLESHLRTIGHQARGSSALAGAYDVGILMRDGGPHAHELHIESRYAEPQPPRLVLYQQNGDGSVQWLDGGEAGITQEILNALRLEGELSSNQVCAEVRHRRQDVLRELKALLAKGTIMRQEKKWKVV